MESVFGWAVTVAFVTMWPTSLRFIGTLPKNAVTTMIGTVFWTAYIIAAAILPFGIDLLWWGVPVCYLAILLLTGIYVGELARRFNVKLGQRQ